MSIMHDNDRLRRLMGELGEPVDPDTARQEFKDAITKELRRPCKVPKGHVLSEYQKHVIARWTPNSLAWGARISFECGRCRKRTSSQMQICGDYFCEVEPHERKIAQPTIPALLPPTDAELLEWYGFTREDILTPKPVPKKKVIPRQYAFVKYIGRPHPAFPPGVPPALFLGEIPNMPGHCVIVLLGQIERGYHTSDFVELTDEET